MLRKSGVLMALAVGITSAALAIGCSNSATDVPVAAAGETRDLKDRSANAFGTHVHKPGGHGGNIVEIGRDNYHAEAVFEKGGAVKLYLLGKDEAKVQEVESQVLTAYAKAEGDTEAAPFSFRPVPQAGDTEGKASQFIGKLPKELGGKSVEVTVPSITIAAERFRFAFQSSSAAHEEGNLAVLADDEERALYLTPGGKYTEADIRANQSKTASEKFHGMAASHDLKPKPGDKICPITLTKANAKFTWIVGGKEYEFCCPPCVDEFVRAAKEHPEEIKEPQDYLKK
jgi:YHS domain-containing protein